MPSSSRVVSTVCLALLSKLSAGLHGDAGRDVSSDPTTPTAAKNWRPGPDPPRCTNWPTARRGLRHVAQTEDFVAAERRPARVLVAPALNLARSSMKSPTISRREFAGHAGLLVIAGAVAARRITSTGSGMSSCQRCRAIRMTGVDRGSPAVSRPAASSARANAARCSNNMLPAIFWNERSANELMHDGTPDWIYREQPSAIVSPSTDASEFQRSMKSATSSTALASSLRRSRRQPLSAPGDRLLRRSARARSCSTTTISRTIRLLRRRLR